MRRITLLLITALLVLSAVLRISNLTRVPDGFTVEEVRDMLIARTIMQGNVASFYNIGDATGGHEGLYPLLLALVTGVLGDGLLNQRILSAWLGIIAVALSYAFTRRLFGSFAGIIGAACACIMLYPILISRNAVRETLLLPLAFFFYWVLASSFHVRQDIRPDPPNTANITLLGVVMAALAYTHWTGLVAFPLMLAYIGLLVRGRYPLSRRTISAVLYGSLVMLILFIPYLVLSIRAFAFSGFNTFWINRPQDLQSLFYSVFRTTGSTFLRGDLNPLHNYQDFSLIGVLALVLSLIGLAALSTDARQPRHLLIILGLVFGFLPGMVNRNAPDFSHIIMAIPVLCAIGGYGTQTLLDAVFGRNSVLKPRILLPVIAIFVLSFGLTFNRLFNAWSNTDKGTLVYSTMGQVASYLDRTRDDLTTSVCAFNLVSERPFTIPDHVLFRMMLHRPHPGLRYSDCVNGLVLTGGGKLQRVAFFDPRGVESVTSILQSWLTPHQPNSIPGVDSNLVITVDQEAVIADQFGWLTRGQVGWSPDTVGPTLNARLPVRMGGYLTFEGYEVTSPRANTEFEPGEQVTLVTYWRADGAQVPGLRLFVHLARHLDVEPLIQNDIISLHAGSLRDRDVFIQVITLPLPADFLSGTYYLSLGAYDNATGERFPIFDQDEPRGDRLILGEIRVVPAVTVNR